MTRTVLVTGATGQVSGALIDALAGSGLRLRAMARDPAGFARRATAGVEVVAADLDHPESLAPAFAGVDDLWLLTPNGPRAPEHSMNAVWAARRAGVERVVRLSAVGAAHDAPTRSGRLHALADHELQQSGLCWTILRPHWFMQNLLGAAAPITAHGAVHLNLGQGRIGMIDVRDVAAVAARVLTSPPEDHHARIYTPTGPRAITLDEAVRELSRAAGRDIDYVAPEDGAAREAMISGGLSPWLAGMLVEYGRAYADGWGDFTTTDVADVVGRPPRSFAAFARDDAAAFNAG